MSSLYGNFNYLLCISEEIRLHFHQLNIVGNHAYDKRHYVDSFLCSAAIESLVRDHKFPDRQTAVAGLRLLQLNQLISVIGKKDVGEADCLARFGRDEKHFRLDSDISLALKAKEIEEKLCGESNGVLTVFHEKLSGSATSFPYFAFAGSTVIDWLVEESKLVASRAEAVSLCRRFQQNQLIKHTEDRYNFEDHPKRFYRFHPEFSVDFAFVDLVRNYLERRGDKERIPSETDCNISERIIEPTADSGPTTPTGTLGVSAILASYETSRETFVRKAIKINSDSVGYGFVLRGNGPSYAQTIDPSGPAATAGLKVGHIIAAVNGVEVLNKSHKDVAKLVVGRKLGSIALTVLQPADF